MKRQGQKFPFPSTIDGAYWKSSVYPHFRSYSLKENGNGSVGLWNNKFQTWYTFSEKEIKKIHQFLETKDRVLGNLFLGRNVL